MSNNAKYYRKKYAPECVEQLGNVMQQEMMTALGLASEIDDSHDLRQLLIKNGLLESNRKIRALDEMIRERGTTPDQAWEDYLKKRVLAEPSQALKRKPLLARAKNRYFETACDETQNETMRELFLFKAKNSETEERIIEEVLGKA